MPEQDTTTGGGDQGLSPAELIDGRMTVRRAERRIFIQTFTELDYHRALLAFNVMPSAAAAAAKGLITIPVRTA